MQESAHKANGASGRSFNGSLLAAFAVLIFAPALATLAGRLVPHWPTGLLLGVSGAAMLLATIWLAWKLAHSAYRTAADGGFADAADTRLPSA